MKGKRVCPDLEPRVSSRFAWHRAAILQVSIPSRKARRRRAELDGCAVS